MTRIVVKKLIFDEWNREHIQRHSVTEEEIKEAGNNLVYHKRTYRGRYLAVGISGKRLIAMVLKREGPGKYYLITVRDAGKKERKVIYEKDKKRNS